MSLAVAFDTTFPNDKEQIIFNAKDTPNKNTKPILEIEYSSSIGGCLIATATYGTELAPQVQQLRELRDNILLQTDSGKSFMNSFNDFYYSLVPK